MCLPAEHTFILTCIDAGSEKSHKISRKRKILRKAYSVCARHPFRSGWWVLVARHECIDTLNYSVQDRIRNALGEEAINCALSGLFKLTWMSSKSRGWCFCYINSKKNKLAELLSGRCYGKKYLRTTFKEWEVGFRLLFLPSLYIRLFSKYIYIFLIFLKFVKFN